MYSHRFDYPYCSHAFSRLRKLQEEENPYKRKKKVGGQDSRAGCIPGCGQEESAVQIRSLPTTWVPPAGQTGWGGQASLTRRY